MLWKSNAIIYFEKPMNAKTRMTKILQFELLTCDEIRRATPYIPTESKANSVKRWKNRNDSINVNKDEANNPTKLNLMATPSTTKP